MDKVRREPLAGRRLVAAGHQQHLVHPRTGGTAGWEVWEAARRRKERN